MADEQPAKQSPDAGATDAAASTDAAQVAVVAPAPVSPRPLPQPDRDATSSTLHSGLRGDVDKLNLLNSVVAIVVGALLFAVPEAFRWLFQLGGTTDEGLRILAASWVLIGLWFAASAAKPRNRLVTTVNALLLLVSAVVLLAAPFILGLDVGWFGWLALFVMAVYLGASATAWMLIRNRMAGRVKPRQMEESEASPAS